VHADDPLKLRSHWIAKFNQIYTQYRQIITDEPYKIKIAIYQAVLECQGDE